MISNNEELKKHFTRFDEVAEDKEDYKERFEFYKAILGFQMDRRKSADPKPEYLREEAAKFRLEEGFPLIDRAAMEPEIGWVAENFEEILNLLEKKTGVDKGNVSYLKKFRESMENFPDFLLGCFKEDEAALEKMKKLPEDIKELLDFVLHNSIKPYFESHAIEYEKLVSVYPWNNGYCPVCGGKPAMNEFRGEEGNRFLLCHRCGFRWSFRRVKCPFCENTNHDTLRYMFFEEEQFYRIDVCDQCKGYLKGIDTRKFPGEVMIEAEDLATPHLDLIAEKQGYVKKAPNILGMFK